MSPHPPPAKSPTETAFLSHLLPWEQIDFHNDGAQRPFCSRVEHLTVKLTPGSKRAVTEALDDPACFDDCSSRLADAYATSQGFIDVKTVGPQAFDALRNCGAEFGRDMVLFAAALGRPLFGHAATSANPISFGGPTSFSSQASFAHPAAYAHPASYAHPAAYAHPASYAHPAVYAHPASYAHPAAYAHLGGQYPSTCACGRGCPAAQPFGRDVRIGPVADATFTYLADEQVDVDLRRETGPGRVPVLILDTPAWATMKAETAFRTRSEIEADVELQGGAGHPDVADNVRFAGDINGDGDVDPAFGHSEFIESIISRLAPSAQVLHEPAVTNFGASTDSVIATQLAGFLCAIGDDAPPGVVSLSVGGYSEADMPPVALGAVIERYVANGWIVVASAGNDASCRPTWPAAFERVIGVGSLGPYGPAPFSNFGPWVNACAPGIGVRGQLPNPYIDVSSEASADADAAPCGETLSVGAIEARMGPQQASWSGTSFSAPIVAAAIAQRAADLAQGKAVDSSHLEQAAEDIVWDEQLLRMPGFGTVVNVT